MILCVGVREWVCICIHMMHVCMHVSCLCEIDKDCIRYFKFIVVQKLGNALIGVVFSFVYRLRLMNCCLISFVLCLRRNIEPYTCAIRTLAQSMYHDLSAINESCGSCGEGFCRKLGVESAGTPLTI